MIWNKQNLIYIYKNELQELKFMEVKIGIKIKIKVKDKGGS
jgi:hypothetical protein